MCFTNQKKDSSPHLIFLWPPWTQIPSLLPFSSPHLWVSLSRLSLPLTGFHCTPGHYVLYHHIRGESPHFLCFCKCIRCSLPQLCIYSSSLWSCDIDTSRRQAIRGGVTFARKTCSMKMSHLYIRKKSFAKREWSILTFQFVFGDGDGLSSAHLDHWEEEKKPERIRQMRMAFLCCNIKRQMRGTWEDEDEARSKSTSCLSFMCV